MNVLKARFTAMVGPHERTAEVITGRDGQFEVYVSDETQSIMAGVLVTRDLEEACRRARTWMDSIDLAAAATP